MSDNQYNIEEIQAYLNGKLDAKAMHRLEREAQSDPFLMDAIEGYQNIETDQLPNFGEVKIRFAVRTAEKRERSILWRVLPIAATLLIVLGIGFLWLSPKKEASVQFSKTVSPLKQSIKETSADTAVSNKIVQPENAVVAVVTPSSENGKIINRNIIASDNNHKTSATVESNTQPEGQSLANKVANRAQSLGVTESNKLPDQTVQIITGKVTDATGHALAGVKVLVKGSQKQAVTDTNGIFNIASVDAQATLSVAYAGYDTKKIALAGKDNLNIVLNEATNELAQVSVPGYADDSLGTGIYPLAGWKAFTNYIKKNAFMPNGETGRVKLAFTVNAKGNITGIRIIRGKSDAMNQKAIALLMNGPQWMGNSDDKELKLKIRFRKVKTT